MRWSIALRAAFTGTANASAVQIHARNELVARGIDVSEVFHDAGGVFHHAGIMVSDLGGDAIDMSFVPSGRVPSCGAPLWSARINASRRRRPPAACGR